MKNFVKEKLLAAQNFLRKNLGGFTVVEMMVVVAVIVIITAIVTVNYRSGQKQLALQRAANKLAQDIRRAQEMAMAAEEASACVGHLGYVYGAGIYININEPDRYHLFGDCNGNNKYQPADMDIIIEPEDFKDVEIAPSPDNTFKKLHIVFTPPEPAVYIKDVPDGQDVDLEGTTITLRIKNDPTKTKTITVNRAGLIYAE